MTHEWSCDTHMTLSPPTEAVYLHSRLSDGGDKDGAHGSVESELATDPQTAAGTGPTD